MSSLSTDYGRRLYRFMDLNGIEMLTFDDAYAIFSSLGEDLVPLNQLERRIKRAFGNNHFIFKRKLFYIIRGCGGNLENFSDLSSIPDEYAIGIKRSESNKISKRSAEPSKAVSHFEEPGKEYTEDNYLAEKRNSLHRSMAQRYNVKTKNIGMLSTQETKKNEEVNGFKKDVSMATILMEYLKRSSTPYLTSEKVRTILKKHFGKSVDVSAFYFRAFNMTSIGYLDGKQLEKFLSSSKANDGQIAERQSFKEEKPAKALNKVSTEEIVNALITYMSQRGITSLPFFSIEEFCLEKYGSKDYAAQLIRDVFFGTKRDIVFLENLSEYLNQIKPDKRNEPTYKYGEWPWIKTDERGPIDPREIVGGLTQVLIHFSGKPYAQMSDCMSFIVDHYPLSNSFRKYFYDIAGDSPMGKVSSYKLKLAKHFYEKDYFDVI
jgi:hypothetical protein